MSRAAEAAAEHGETHMSTAGQPQGRNQFDFLKRLNGRSVDDGTCSNFERQDASGSVVGGVNQY